MHVVIAGNIGAGKTSLTEILQKHYNWEALFEDVVENLKAHNKKVRKLLNQKRYLSEIDGEIYLVKVSETIDDISEDQTWSLEALDGIRDWLEEWSDEERHTRSVSGLLIDE